MASRISLLTETVARCVPRQDGGYLIVTRKGKSAVATSEIPEGAHIVIRDGLAVRAAR
jgi:hypothetical protein